MTEMSNKAGRGEAVLRLSSPHVLHVGPTNTEHPLCGSLPKRRRKQPIPPRDWRPWGISLRLIFKKVMRVNSPKHAGRAFG